MNLQCFALPFSILCSHTAGRTIRVVFAQQSRYISLNQTSSKGLHYDISSRPAWLALGRIVLQYKTSWLFFHSYKTLILKNKINKGRSKIRESISSVRETFLNGIQTTNAANAIMEKHSGLQLAQISSWIS